MSDCVKLFSLPDFQPAEQPEEQIVEDVLINIQTLRQLEEQFKGCERLAPVVVIGNPQRGKSFILDKIVGIANKTPFQTFGEFRGAIAYPLPVQRGSFELLLIEMSGMEFDAEGKESVMAKKMLHALLSMASICIICLEKNSKIFQYITEIIQIHEDMQQHSGLALSKFFICVETKQALDSSALRNGYRDFSRGNYMGKCEFFYRGREGFEVNEFLRMINILSQDICHRPYEETHRPCQRSLQDPGNPEPLSMIQSLCIILETLGELANCDYTLEAHIEKVLNFAHEFNVQKMQMGQLKKSIDCVRDLEALLFFKRVGIQIKIDDISLARLRANYQENTPLVVMTFFGFQGLGKSTVINRIVQHLLGSRECKEICKVGNTTNHTTTESYVLSHPLKLPESNLDLMLVDLEGLEDLDTLSKREQIKQNNLVSSVLTVTSVYCIFVRNERDIIKFIEERLEQISKLKDIFRCKVERIFLLFHDKDINSEQNAKLIQAVNEWNGKYFSSNAVIKILNKPNFKDSGNYEMTTIFLTNLLSDSSFPKKRETGEPMNIFEIISNMRLIYEYEEAELEPLKLNYEEVIIKNDLIEEKRNQIEACYLNLKCTNEHSSLVETFNSGVSKILACAQSELGDPNTAISKHVFAALNTEIDFKCLPLIEAENVYNAIKGRRIGEIKAEISAIINSAYKLNYWSWKFQSISDQLKTKLQGLPRYYPFMKATIDDITNYIYTLTDSLNNWYYFHYVTNVLLLASAALSIPAFSVRGAAWVAARFGPTVLAETVTETATAILASVAHIGGSKIATGVTQYINEQKAASLYDAKLRVDLLQRTNVEQLGSSMGAVLLIIGMKNNTNINIFLNEFIRYVYPLHTNRQDAFTKSDSIQALMFSKEEYQNEGLAEEAYNIIVRFGVIIYVPIETTGNIEKSKRLSMISAKLMTKSTYTYFVYDSTPECADSFAQILEAYQPIDKRYARAIIPPRVIVNQELFDSKQIKLELCLMQISASETRWRLHLSLLYRNLFDKATLTPQEVRDITLQARDLYLQTLALPLYEEATFSSHITPRQKLIQSLTDAHEREELAIFLTVGRKNMRIHHFLNGFMKSTFTLPGEYEDAFNDKTNFQAHLVQLTKNVEGNQQRVLHGVLVYIQMKEPNDVKLATMVAMFLAKATFTCFFLDSTEDTDSYLRSILNVYQPEPESMKSAWIIVPTTGMKNTVHLGYMLQNKILRPNIQPMHISKTDLNWKNSFRHFKAYLSENGSVTSQEFKDIVIRAQLFYEQQPAFLYLNSGTVSTGGLNDYLATSSMRVQETADEMEILLLIGKKGMTVPEYASRFIQKLYSVSALHYSPFNDAARIQVATFLVRGANQGNMQVVRQILVVYLRMKEKTQKPKAQRLAKVAASLLSKSSITCFFHDSSKYQGTYLASILNCYQPHGEMKKNANICMLYGGDISNIKMQLEQKLIQLSNHDIDNVITSLLTVKPITPQEGKGLLADAQKLYLYESALPLYLKEKRILSFLGLKTRRIINKDFIKIIADSQPNEKFVTLLTVGRENMHVDLLLNRFMEFASSLSERCCNMFNDSTQVQAFSFRMRGINAYNQDILNHVLIIYIRMESNTGTRKARRLSALARNLMSKSALPCLFLHSARERNEETQNILEAYEGGKVNPWIILPLGEDEGAMTHLKNYFLEKEIYTRIQRMSIQADQQACKAQVLQLNADLGKMTPCSLTDVIWALHFAGIMANKVR